MDAPLAPAGRELRAGGARLAGVVSCLPAQEQSNQPFVERFGEAAVRDVVKMIGVERRRRAAEHQTTADLCRAAGEHLLRGLGWRPDQVDAVLFVSQTPDYRLPGTAFVLQAAWGLPAASIALDINLGCSAYPQALWLGMNLIRSGAARACCWRWATPSASWSIPRTAPPRCCSATRAPSPRWRPIPRRRTRIS